MPYQPIGDYGVIGDLHTAALVGRDGSIDWLCLPRFDSPSLFAAVLDDAKGGRFRIAPVGRWTSVQRYLPGTNVLVTAFHSDAGGVAEVTDFMPVGPARTDHAEVHRRVVCTRGTVEMDVRFEPRFDYARRGAVLRRRVRGVFATDAERDVATLAGPPELEWRIAGDAADARLALRAGDTAWFVLRADDDEVHPVDAYASQAKLDQTARWWDDWVAQCTYRGPYRAEVERSALALKLCCYQPTGAIVAAPTTSLPEAIGGGRNWDYRYTWLRDAAFVLYGLERLGFGAESDGFFRFLKRVTRRTDQRHVQIMFGVDHRRDLPEEVLDHLAGYRGSRPVRVGNGAAGQFQLDVYGDLLLAASSARGRRHVTEGLWEVLRYLVDWTAGHWREPDWSIWEARQEPRHYVFSKVMAWAALVRGAAIAEDLGFAADTARWRREAEALHAEVCERGWDPERQVFTQAYGSPDLDAGALIIPKVRFLPSSDPRVRSSLAAIRRELASSCEELIYRYRAADGLPPGEGAFVICSFWMVQNLALTGDFAEAERLFRLLVRRGNHVGLFAEEIDPATGEHLGNFPQALSHAALLNTACILERLRPPAGAG